MPHLISFDIDGTLETGNGPGPITLEMVRRAAAHGHIIGSCSDRPVQDQRNMWASAGIEISFAVLKHKLDTVKAQFTEVEAYYHIGDTEMDEHYARLSGFEFLQVQTMEPHPWMLNEAGVADWGPQGRGKVAMRAPSATSRGEAVPQPENWDSVARLLSFDIDGVLEIGEPPGPITMAMVRRAQELGYTVGSCSDRPGGWQRMAWEAAGISVAFAVQKHQLERAHAQFPDAESYEHVGVSERDDRYSQLGGFKFLPAYQVEGQPWTHDAAGATLQPYTERLSQSEMARINGA